MFICIAKSNNLLIQDLQGDMVQTKKGITVSKSSDRQDHLIAEVDPDVGRFYICRINIVPIIFGKERLDI